MAEERKHLAHECRRRAAEARQLAGLPGTKLDERADLIEVEQKSLSLLRDSEFAGVGRRKVRKYPVSPACTFEPTGRRPTEPAALSSSASSIAR